MGGKGTDVRHRRRRRLAPLGLLIGFLHLTFEEAVIRCSPLALRGEDGRSIFPEHQRVNEDDVRLAARDETVKLVGVQVGTEVDKGRGGAVASSAAAELLVLLF